MVGVLFRSWRRKENPGTDNLTSVGCSIRNAAPENVGIFNVLCKCQLLQDDEHIDFAPNVRSHY